MRSLGPATDRDAGIGAELAEMGPCVLSPTDLALCRTAEDVLDRARLRADRWEEAARGRHDATLARARRAGREEGVAEAAAEIARLGVALRALREGEEARARALALEVVRALFDGLEEEERIAAAARRALAENPRADGARLVVRPQAAEAVAAALAATPGIEVAADAAVAPGEARLDTVLGAIHLSAERQLAVAATLLAPPSADGAPSAADGAPSAPEAGA